MATFEIDGVLPVIPTPFTRDGGLDWAALDGLLEFAIRARVGGVVLPAYASEFYKLRDGRRVRAEFLLLFVTIFGYDEAFLGCCGLHRTSLSSWQTLSKSLRLQVDRSFFAFSM
jgi:hypothetical protein